MANKKITELIQATNIANTDLMLLETTDGTRSIPYSKVKEPLVNEITAIREELENATSGKEDTYSKTEVDDLITNLCNEINTLADKVDKMSLQLPKEITDWNYTLDDANNTITLSNYTGSDTDVTVYANYSVDGKLYYTQIESNNNELEKYMFEGNETVQNITFDDKLDTSKVTDMYKMFRNCSNLSSINFGKSFNTKNVTNMEYMFFGCRSLTSLDLTSFNTSNVTSMICMFTGCSNLESLNLNSFDTHNVTYMGSMFSGCSNLESLNLNSFDTSNVTDMSYMFGNCNSIRQLDLTNFNTTRLFLMGGGSPMSNMGKMFEYCSRLTTILVDEDLWAWDSHYDETQLSDIFYECGTSNVTFIDKGYI